MIIWLVLVLPWIVALGDEKQVEVEMETEAIAANPTTGASVIARNQMTSDSVFASCCPTSKFDVQCKSNECCFQV